MQKDYWAFRSCGPQMPDANLSTMPPTRRSESLTFWLSTTNHHCAAPTLRQSHSSLLSLLWFTGLDWVPTYSTMDFSSTKGKERATDDGFFMERLEMLYEQSLGDLRAFAEREGRSYEEVSVHSSSS